jgi:hypothetical protein
MIKEVKRLPIPKTERGFMRDTFTNVIEELLLAHHSARQTILLYGNSGYGKSSTIKSFTAKKGWGLETIYCITLDPLTTSMPVAAADHMRFIPNEVIHRLCNATKPTIALFDETNKFTNPSVENMLNSIFLDRSYNGHKFSDQVLIVGCMNFVQNSGTAQELDYSIINRATNILYAPDIGDIKQNMQTPLGSLLAENLPMRSSGVAEFGEEVLDRLEGDPEETSPRQLDAIGEILQYSPDLSDAAIKFLCIGRLGKKKGKLAADVILKNRGLVNVLDATTQDKVVKLYKTGERAHVNSLVSSCSDIEVALYVAEQTASPQLTALVLNKFGNKTMLPNGEMLLGYCLDKKLISVG